MKHSIHRELEEFKSFNKKQIAKDGTGIPAIDDYAYYDFFSASGQLLSFLTMGAREVVEKEIYDLQDIWFGSLWHWCKSSILEAHHFTQIQDSAYRFHKVLQKINQEDADSFLDIFLNEKFTVFNLLNRQDAKDDDLSVRLSFAQAAAFTAAPFSGDYIQIEKEEALSRAAFEHPTLQDEVEVSRLGIRNKKISALDFFLMIGEEANITLYCLLNKNVSDAVYYVLNRMPVNKTNEIIDIFDKFKLNTLEGAQQTLEFIKITEINLKNENANPYHYVAEWKTENLQKLKNHAQVVFDRESLQKNIPSGKAITNILKI